MAPGETAHDREADARFWHPLIIVYTPNLSPLTLCTCFTMHLLPLAVCLSVSRGITEMVGDRIGYCSSVLVSLWFLSDL